MLDNLGQYIICEGYRKMKGFEEEHFEIYQHPKMFNEKICVRLPAGYENLYGYKTVESAKSAVRRYLGSGIKWKKINLPLTKYETIEEKQNDR